MKFSRVTAGVTLTGVLALSACTDAGTDDGGATSGTVTDASTASAEGASDDAATTATSAPSADAVAETAGATSEPMTTDEARAAMTVEEAEAVAATVMTARHESFQGDGKKVRDAQRKAFMGSARKATEAADRLEDIFGEPSEKGQDEAAEPNVLAISRDDGDLPIFLLVQTVPEDEVPVLHLLESRTGEHGDFRIIWEASMLPGTKVPTFDRRSVGTPVVRDGRGDLEQPARETLKQLASYTSWPQPEEVPDFRTHGYSPAVRKAAESQAAAVADQADLREKNWLVNDDVKTLLFEDGSAFVIGTLLRDTSFTVKANSVLNPPETFVEFAGADALTEEAVLRTMVFVGLRVPTQEVELKPEMIAVREQLVDAWGS